MKCKIENDMARYTVDNIIKDCCNQEKCCEECGFEDCHEGCDIFENEQKYKCKGCQFCEK